MRRALRFALPLLAGLAAPVAADTALVQAADRSSASSTSAVSFGDALNAYRAQHGLGALREDGTLTRAAQRYAEAMAAGGFFSHTGQDGSNLATRARAAGCAGRGYFAENIAWGQRSASDAFNGWVASSGHRANMLGRPYAAFGLGQASGYWVLMFADAC